jgi:Rrf2 family protein
MKISTKGRYALRTMIDLANQENKEPISLKEIALRQAISVKYLESIIAVLHKAGFVTSTRGKNGGYVLTKKPADYTVGSVLKLTEKTLAPVNCVEDEKGNCSRADQCFTLPLWQELDRIIDQYLESVTIEDLLSQTVVKNQEGPL